jgi:Coenzyme PQQ synthesis protein D (PqqD)
MDQALLAPTVLSATGWCVLRKQKERYLVYNSHTDELHLIPPTGYCVYQMCDGLNTVGDIRRLLAEATGQDEADLQTLTDSFLCQLLDRGILEASDG